MRLTNVKRKIWIHGRKYLKSMKIAILETQKVLTVKMLGNYTIKQINQLNILKKWINVKILVFKLMIKTLSKSNPTYCVRESVHKIPINNKE